MIYPIIYTYRKEFKADKGYEIVGFKFSGSHLNDIIQMKLRTKTVIERTSKLQLKSGSTFDEKEAKDGKEEPGGLDWKCSLTEREMGKRAE
eukprot:778945-Amorphochlora_amoeboformis.AAC.1